MIFWVWVEAVHSDSVRGDRIAADSHKQAAEHWCELHYQCTELSAAAFRIPQVRVSEEGPAATVKHFAVQGIVVMNFHATEVVEVKL
jgi:hypothetical protein